MSDFKQPTKASKIMAKYVSRWVRGETVISKAPAIHNTLGVVKVSVEQFKETDASGFTFTLHVNDKEYSNNRLYASAKAAMAAACKTQIQ